MNIIWYGQSAFKITTQGQKTKEKVNIVIDPFDSSTGLKLPKVEGDIFLFTHNHGDHNNRSVVGKDSFVIDSPGEYELKDIFIQGIMSFHDESKGKERGLNTIYTIEAEDIRICHLGDFGEAELSDKQLQQIGEVDILMIPVGGEYTIDAKKATKIISQVEPRIVVPMHYKIKGLKLNIDDLEQFLKAMGQKSTEKEEKIVIQKKGMPIGEMKIIPLIPQSKSSSDK